MGEIKNSELFQRLKVYFLDLLQSSAGGPGPYAPSPHDLMSAYHSGSLSDSQAPQFLKADGSRNLTGNLDAAEGVLIDGVDISAFKGLYDVHAAANAATAHSGVGVHSHQSTAQGSLLDHGLALTGLGDDDHTQYAMADGAGTRSAYMAERLNKSVIAGNGLTGGGALSSNVTLAIVAADTSLMINEDNIQVRLAENSGLAVSNGLLVGAGNGISISGSLVSIDQSFSPTWTGEHIFAQSLHTAHILPTEPDTFDIGSANLIYRKGFVSELEALIFAENTISSIGGMILITKDQGVLPTELSDSATTYDFGKVMTPNDFLILRSLGQVEYIQVGTLISGTTYNISRNLDGSGANMWPAGAVWADLGYNANGGYILLDGYNTPRISLATQGSAYNAQTELIRLGDLNANWGYTSATYGLAIGKYESGKVNLTIDPTNGYRLRTYNVNQFTVTPNLLKFGSNVGTIDTPLPATTALVISGATQTYNSESIGDGDLLIGDNSAGKANILWKKAGTDAGRLLIRGGTTTQIYIDTDGSIKWGGGIGTLDSAGLKVTTSSYWENLRAYTFCTPSGTITGGIFAKLDSGGIADMPYVALKSMGLPKACTQIFADASTTSDTANVFLSAISGYWVASISLDADDGLNISNITISADTLVKIYGNTNIDDNLTVGGDVRIGGGLYVGSTATDPPVDCIYVDSDGRFGGGIYVGQLGVDPADDCIYADGKIFINETENTKQTIGLTINQGANDDEAFAIKSSDIAHGTTAQTETDTYFTIAKISGDKGGAVLKGFAEDMERGFQINGCAQSPWTSKNTGTWGLVAIFGLQTSGTTVTNATADAAIFTVATYKDSAYKTVFIVDEDGDIAVDGSSSIATFDEYDDVKLLTGLRAALMPEKAELREQFGKWMEYAREPLSKAGIVTYNDDGHHFISLKGLHMLEIDAIRQMSDKINDLVIENTILKEKLDYVNSRLMLLTGGA